MKKLINMLAIAAFSLAAITTAADPGMTQDRQRPERPDREEIQSLKIAFMTKEMDLTSEESQKFWPVYNKYWEEKDAITREKRGLMRKIREEQVSDAEIDRMVKLMKDELAVFEKYVAEFKSILPAYKVAKIFTAEEGFKRQLLQRASERGEGGPPR